MSKCGKSILSSSSLTSRKTKIIRISTVPISLNVFCKGLLEELSNYYEIVAVSSPGTDLEKVEMREKVRTIAVPMRRHIYPLHDLISLWQLFWLFRREKPDGAQHHAKSRTTLDDSCKVGWCSHQTTHLHWSHLAHS